MADSATGDGPVSALCNTIDRIVGLEGTLIDYKVHSVTEGRDAVGEVFMRVVFNGSEFSGKAASTDVMDATARAYLNAVNKAIHARERGAAGQQPAARTGV